MENKLRKRLEILKRRAQRLNEPGSAGPERDKERAIPAPEREERKEIGADGHPPVTLAGAVPGVLHDTPHGPCYLVARSGERVDNRGGGESGRFERLMATGPSLQSLFGRQMRGSSSGPAPAAEKIAFYDIETAGLSPTAYLFLCGVLSVRDGKFQVEQILARDYPEEKAMLHRLRDLLERFDYVVTFNGRSFDLPFTRTRMAVNRIDFTESFAILDLLGPTRKAFSKRLPNCKLGTVEYYLTGEERIGDVPGRDIPLVYHEFVHSGDARMLAGVLYHNRMDLLTMVIILNELLR